jgi:hypothetical protein
LARKLIALNFSQKVLNFCKIYTPKFLGCYNGVTRSPWRRVRCYSSQRLAVLQFGSGGGRPRPPPRGARARGSSYHRRWGASAGELLPAPRARVAELDPARCRGRTREGAPTSFYFGDFLFLIDVAIVVYRCCNNVLDMLQSFIS